MGAGKISIVFILYHTSTGAVKFSIVKESPVG